ncbi:ATP-binding protein [Atopobium fossor]|uniref:ATP-binding protein n=1 Tax=Atopobium fossor TaxID=39487 RepID=UPI0003FECFD0|nr:AAA family ATPase [Atopobium fossor]
MTDFFRRKAYDKLAEWKRVSDGRTALLIEGARRIGKSTVAERFAQENYTDYLLIDFSLEGTDVRDNFSNIDNLDAFFRNLFLLKGKSLPIGDSVIIFDEVQLYPPARQAIKALVKDGRYHYIETGSLISIHKNVKDILIPSEEERIKMYPMDFEEFLWAMDDKVSIPAIWDAFESRKPLPDAIHRRIMRDFRTYMAVGGMPQAVELLVQGDNFTGIDRIKRTILDLYEEDLGKHDEDTKERVAELFKSIPSQLSHHNSHFQFATVSKAARARSLARSMAFLRESMMVNMCCNVTAPEVALGLYENRDDLKVYLCDTGLLITQVMRGDPQAGDELYRALVTDRLGINEGMLVENAVAQALAANGHRLYFHRFTYCPTEATKENTYEVDFLIVRGKRICPIEVKSSGYKSHKSFDYFIEKYDTKINERFIVYTKNLAREGNLTYLPLYMTMCL